MRFAALFLGMFLATSAATTAVCQSVDLRPIARPAADPVTEIAVQRPRLRPVTEAPALPMVAAVVLRPVARPNGVAPTPQGEPAQTDRPVLRPFERPELARGAQTRAQLRAEQNLFAFSPTAIPFSLRPVVRPAAITQRAVDQRIARARGQVCGDPAIQGETLGRVPGRGACGIDSGVRVRSVAGVTLRPAATIDCRTATALKGWVARTAKPAVGQMGGGVQSLRVVSHYACRNRNSASSGRLSEHAFGRAIDIAGIGLKNGQEITVLTDWNRGAAGRALAAMWRGACGPFGTVLGPNANAAHRDHFHFDTARYRSGSYCR